MSRGLALSPALGGVIVDSGKFNWTNGKFPLIADPDPSYHGLNFVEALKPLGNIAYIIHIRTHWLRDTGACMSPFAAFLFLLGIETLQSLNSAITGTDAGVIFRYIPRNIGIGCIFTAGVISILKMSGVIVTALREVAAGRVNYAHPEMLKGVRAEYKSIPDETEFIGDEEYSD